MALLQLCVKPGLAGLVLVPNATVVEELPSNFRLHFIVGQSLFLCRGEGTLCQCLSLALLTFVPSWKGTYEGEDTWIEGRREFTLVGVNGGMALS